MLMDLQNLFGTHGQRGKAFPLPSSGSVQLGLRVKLAEDRLTGEKPTNFSFMHTWELSWGNEDLQSGQA